MNIEATRFSRLLFHASSTQSRILKWFDRWSKSNDYIHVFQTLSNVIIRKIRKLGWYKTEVIVRGVFAITILLFSNTFKSYFQILLRGYVWTFYWYHWNPTLPIPIPMSIMTFFPWLAFETTSESQPCPCPPMIDLLKHKLQRKINKQIKNNIMQT